MTTVYIEEIFDDDDGPPTHTEDGEVIEQMDPVTMPVHTLTQDMVAAAEAFLMGAHRRRLAPRLPLGGDFTGGAG